MRVIDTAERSEPGIKVMLSQTERDPWIDMRTKILTEAEDVFHTEGEMLRATGYVEHSIRLKQDGVVSEKQRRYPHRLVPLTQTEIEKLMKETVVKKSVSEFCSPIWMVPKKTEAGQPHKYRMVVDFRRLNQSTITETHPMPRLEDILDKAAKSKVFSTIYLHAGYHQVKMRKADMHTTAFKFGRDNYECTRMPFGLNNGPASFQRLMNEVFEELGGTYTQAFMDDILVYSKSESEHIFQLRKVCGCLRKFGLKASKSKTKLFLPSVRFLGHILSQDGAKSYPEKIEAIKQVSYSSTLRQVRQLLGAVGFFRRFIPYMAGKTTALADSLRKDRRFQCTPAMEREVDECKAILSSGIILQYPELNKPFILTTDASDGTLGAVLSKHNGSSERPVAYASRKLSGPATRYSATKREFLAIVCGIEQFRPYLYGAEL